MIDGNAIIYCEGAFNTPNGKTAHGLVRFTKRYRVLSIIDSRYAGRDAGILIDGVEKGIAVLSSLKEGFREASKARHRATHFVFGIAPDGGRLNPETKEVVKCALTLGLNVDCGLHDLLSEDRDIARLAAENRVTIRDVRRTPPLGELHSFSGKIEEVNALTVAVLGTDSAVGKRTTAWLLIQALDSAGHRAELVGTGQTAWMQGARYCIMLDSLINDFVSGEIEHAVWSVWKERNPDVIVIEGQGSLMNPAYPGGFEILAAGRPDIVILQHAPARREYDGFPGYPIQPLPHQIKAIEIVSGRRVEAVTVNHEDLPRDEIPAVCRAITRETGLPAFDVLADGAGTLAEEIIPSIEKRRNEND